MTGGEERDRPARPLSEMKEARPDDLFAGRTRRSGGQPDAEPSYSGDDDLFGPSSPMAPDEWETTARSADTDD